MRVFLALAILILDQTACRTKQDEAPNSRGFTPSAEFNAYWNVGLAEVTRYDLEQARYGELRKGEMVVVFVTEPFRTDRQVKAEGALTTNTTTVLKGQTMRRFATGIYDYEITTTAFKPLDTALYPKALKVSASAIDWCGQWWLQLNYRASNYRAQIHSYFEDEADEDFNAGDALAEDEIWQRIRLDPARLPQGDMQAIPALASLRLRHRRATAEKAHATIRPSAKDNTMEYTLRYADASADERIVAWSFAKVFPHRIVQYSETYLDGFQSKKKLTTTAKLRNVLQVAYWRENSATFATSRNKLHIKGFDP